MDTVVIDALPALGADPAIAAEVHATNLANLRRFLFVARHAADPPPPDVPPEALDIARTLVRRGIESDVAYQGYRRGQQVAWQRWMACAEEVVGPGERLAPVLDESLQLMFDYIDQVLGRVIAEMQREREEVIGGALARRTETVRLILDGAALDVNAASGRLRLRARSPPYGDHRVGRGRAAGARGTRVRRADTRPGRRRPPTAQPRRGSQHTLGVDRHRRRRLRQRAPRGHRPRPNPTSESPSARPGAGLPGSAVATRPRSASTDCFPATPALDSSPPTRNSR